MRIYFSLGTNLGNREQNLRTAVQKMEERIGKLVSLSSFFATEPWGFRSDNAFLNAACCIDIAGGLAVHDVLHLTQEIEREMGRTHKSVAGQYADRIIDIDLLLAFDPQGAPIRVSTPQLTLPHPLMHERDFVMKPLGEIL